MINDNITLIHKIMFQHWMDNQPVNRVKNVDAGEVKWKLEYGVKFNYPFNIKKKELKIG